MVTSVNSQQTNATMEFNNIAKIRKYKEFHEGHHFIPMAMKMHDILEHDMDHFFKECAHLFHNERSKIHLSLSFCIELFRQHVNIVL